MYAMDQTIVATALHTLQVDMHASISVTGWTITIYAVGQIIVLPLTGRLGNRYGRRRMFLACVALFSLASLGCALADNVYVLILMRAVEAVGGAGFTPSATGIVVEHFGRSRDRAVGLFGSIFPIGAMAGPVIGGLFITFWTWRGIFLINVPIGALLIAAALWLIPADRPSSVAPTGRADLLGMGQLSAGTVLVMAGITYLGSTAATPLSPAFAIPTLAGLTLLAAFVRHSRHSKAPLVPMRLLAGRGFGAMNVINFLWGGMSLGLGALIPLYATNRYGIDALSSGTLLTVRGVATVVLSTLAAWALRRTGYRRPMYIGFVLTAAGMFAMSTTPLYGSAYLWLSLGAGITGLGIGWSNPATRNAGLQLAPEQSSTIAALRTMGMQAGSVIFISVTTAIIAAAGGRGSAQGAVFAAGGIIMMAALPLIVRVPEHHGAW